jgi:hypothetical protein
MSSSEEPPVTKRSHKKKIRVGEVSAAAQGPIRKQPRRPSTVDAAAKEPNPPAFKVASKEPLERRRPRKKPNKEHVSERPAMPKEQAADQLDQRIGDTFAHGGPGFITVNLAESAGEWIGEERDFGLVLSRAPGELLTCSRNERPGRRNVRNVKCHGNIEC